MIHFNTIFLDFRGHNTVFLRQRLPVDFPVFNVQVPPNENRSHRLNTTLRAMVEIAGDQPARAANDKAVVRKAPDMSIQIGIMSPDYATFVLGVSIAASNGEWGTEN